MANLLFYIYIALSGLSLDEAFLLANHESGLNHKAHRKGSKFYGLWQIHEEYFVRYTGFKINKLDSLTEDYNRLAQAITLCSVMNYLKERYKQDKVGTVAIFGAGYKGFSLNKCKFRRKVSKIFLTQNQSLTKKVYEKY